MQKVMAQGAYNSLGVTLTLRFISIIYISFPAQFSYPRSYSPYVCCYDVGAGTKAAVVEEHTQPTPGILSIGGASHVEYGSRAS